VRERLLDLVDTTLDVLVADDGREMAAHIGSALAGLGYRTPEALGATLEVLSTALVEELESEEAVALRPRLGQLLGGIAEGFGAATRHLLLNEQEASREAVLAENRRAWDALRRQAALLDLAPDAIIVRHVESGRIVFWNNGAETLYGWRADEALDRVCHVLLNTESARPLDEIEAGLFRDGHWEGELVHRRHDGSQLIVSSRWAPQWDDYGNPLACLEINTDITARKEIEAALREREASLEQAQLLAHLGSWEVNVVSDVHYWSPEAYRLLGYRDREVPPTQDALFDAVHPDDAPRVRQAIADAMADSSYAFEMRTAGRDGVERILLCQNELMRDADGLPLKLVGTALDVTERKRAEAERVQLSVMQAARTEAEAARQRVAFLAEASRVLASSLDYATTLQNVTAIAVPTLADACQLDLVGADGQPAQVAQTTRQEWAPIAAPTRDELARVLESRLPKRRPNALLIPLASREHVQGVISYLAGPDRPHYTEVELALAEDFALRCDLAIENARLHAEAQRATRLRDEFLSVAAHELKTPMTTLRGYAQWLMRPLSEDRMPEPSVLGRGLHAIDTQSAKLVDLTTQLLDVSRIEAGKLSLDTRQVNVVELVRAAVEAARSTTQMHTLELSAPAEYLATVDPLRLEQVISNLIDNAIKYSPDGGAIDIEVAAEGSARWRLVVRDHGLGIPLERRENLFDRFYQAHGEGHFGGLGLGLYISRQIVELHGGRISAEFPADGGSRFLIRLPAATPARRER
jgi:PAS domain S-box-containing protein